MIKNIIFDCDGVLFNTERVSIKECKKWAQRHGYEMTDAVIEKMTGANVNDCNKLISNTYGKEASYDEMHGAVHEAIMLQSQEKNSLNMLGLIEILDYLSEMDIPFSIASSSNLDYVKSLLSSLDKTYNFRSITTGDTVTNSKPNPEIFLKCANDSKFNPKECLVVEDSINGVIAANRANMFTCFIEDTIKFNKTIENNITFRVKNLLELIKLLKIINY